jgi:hypothetical protein
VIESNSILAYQALAWLQATCPDPKYRDAKNAVINANQALRLTEEKDPWVLDAAAAAYAESGNFAKAQEFETKAIGLLSDDADKETCQKRLELYKLSKPYHQEPMQSQTT